MAKKSEAVWVELLGWGGGGRPILGMTWLTCSMCDMTYDSCDVCLWISLGVSGS